MSLCDHCYAPGQCCKSMSLSNESGPLTTWAGDGEAERQMAEYGLPFVPLDEPSWEGKITDEASEDFGRDYVQHRWRCTKLTADGRCSIYDDRPKLCREFEAGVSNMLCVHFNGAESGDPSIGFLTI